MGLSIACSTKGIFTDFYPSFLFRRRKKFWCRHFAALNEIRFSTSVRRIGQARASQAQGRVELGDFSAESAGLAPNSAHLCQCEALCSPVGRTLVRRRLPGSPSCAS